MWYRFIDTNDTPSKRFFFYSTKIDESRATQFTWWGLPQPVDNFEAETLTKHDVKCRVFVLHAIIAQRRGVQIPADGTGFMSIFWQRKIWSGCRIFGKFVDLMV
jgi:hypothetical protein